MEGPEGQVTGLSPLPGPGVPLGLGGQPALMVLTH